MQTTTTADGTSIAYADSGPIDTSSEPAVVLVHGITESRATWAPVTARLAASHRVIALDLRGHGESGPAERYDLEAMASDVAAVASACGLDRPHLVGHSLGGVVVSAVGAAMPVSSVVNVDQSLSLATFKEGLMPVEAALRDPAGFEEVISALFAQLAGTKLSIDESARISDHRRADQEVVLGVWELIFSSSVEEIDAAVAEALAGYADGDTPYLSLFGIDPGPDYEQWLTGFIPEAHVELWAEHGHYPHLVDPDRFVSRLEAFWSA